MSVDKVREYFKQFGIEQRIMEFDVSSATVELAAKALNCDPDRIAKSLSFKIGDKPILVLFSGEARIDNKKYKEYFHNKAKMLSPEEVTTLIGHNIGGVCPFGINEGVDVYLDVSLRKYETVFPACGSSNSAIELNLDELEKYSNSLSWIDVSKEKAAVEV